MPSHTTTTLSSGKAPLTLTLPRQGVTLVHLQQT